MGRCSGRCSAADGVAGAGMFLPPPPVLLVVRWQALDDAISGKHTAVDAEVSAHHECSHGSILSSQVFRFVYDLYIGLVLTTIDQNKTTILAGAAAVTLVLRVRPSSSTTKTWGSVSVLKPGLRLTTSSPWALGYHGCCFGVFALPLIHLRIHVMTYSQDRVYKTLLCRYPPRIHAAREVVESLGACLESLAACRESRASREGCKMAAR
jgi:hypothetical protein